MNEVIRVHADAVATHQSGTQLDKVPLAAGRFEHIVRVDAHGVENLGQFVHEGDVHVALAVFNNFRGLGHLDAGRLMGAVDKDTVVHGVHQIGNLRRRAGRHLFDFLHRMGFVAGIDALGTVAGEEVHIETQSGHMLHDRQALLLGHSRING